MDRIGVWFTQGYSNLFHALQDVRKADVHEKYRLVCSHPSREFVALQSADVRLVEPVAASDARYLSFVKATVREHGIQVIFPSRKQALLNKYAQELHELGVTVATVADTHTLRRIDNKGRLYRYLQGKGVVTLPAFHCVRSTAGFDRSYKALKAEHAKVCIKPTVGVYGSGFRVLKEGPNTLQDLLTESLSLSVEDLRSRLSQGPGRELMVMQYLEGDERSVDCLAHEGKLLGAVIRRKSNSSSAAQIIEDSPALVAQVAGLVELLNLNGMFNVQFKDSGGVPHLLEINTRLSGRSYYATLAGLNIPYLAAEVFSGQLSPEAVAWELTPGMLIGNVNSPVVLQGVTRRGACQPGTPESF